VKESKTIVVLLGLSIVYIFIYSSEFAIIVSY